MIETVNCTRKFADLTAVDGVTLLVEEGEVFGFLGPNGAGKTTTVRMLCCLIRIRGTAVGTGTAINPCEEDGRRRTKVNRSSLPIEFGAVGNRVVMSAIRALNRRDRELWFELFSEKPSSPTTASVATL